MNDFDTLSTLLPPRDLTQDSVRSKAPRPGADKAYVEATGTLTFTPAVDTLAGITTGIRVNF